MDNHTMIPRDYSPPAHEYIPEDSPPTDEFAQWASYCARTRLLDRGDVQAIVADRLSALETGRLVDLIEDYCLWPVEGGAYRVTRFGYGMAQLGAEVARLVVQAIEDLVREQEDRR